MNDGAGNAVMPDVLAALAEVERPAFMHPFAEDMIERHGRRQRIFAAEHRGDVPAVREGLNSYGAWMKVKRAEAEAEWARRREAAARLDGDSGIVSARENDPEGGIGVDDYLGRGYTGNR